MHPSAATLAETFRRQLSALRSQASGAEPRSGIPSNASSRIPSDAPFGDSAVSASYLFLDNAPAASPFRLFSTVHEAVSAAVSAGHPFRLHLCRWQLLRHRRPLGSSERLFHAGLSRWGKP